MTQAVTALAPLTQSSRLYVHQEQEWVELLVDWETGNRYSILDQSQARLGMLAERTEGFWTTVKRLIFRSHRPLHIDFFDPDGSVRLTFRRSFFFFFSDLSVESHDGTPLGSVHRRFGILHKKYDLLDASGRCFARIETPIWRLWTFPLFRGDGQRVGEISKKWSGLLREVLSDADTFQVNFGAAAFGEVERAVILAAAISIDFDFFEDNQPKRGLLRE